MDFASNHVGSPGCVAHFLVNRGSIALSGAPRAQEGFVAIEVTDISPNLLEKIDRREGLCVLASGGQKWRFDLGPLDLAKEGDRSWLSAKLPSRQIEIPTRQAPRRELPAGAARLRVEGAYCPIVNISEGGCAFMASPAMASRLPLHAPVAVEILCGQTLALQTEATIARVSYEIANEPGSAALVSCRFMSSQAGELLDALA